jgi:hypothetical protein
MATDNDDGDGGEGGEGAEETPAAVCGGAPWKNRICPCCGPKVKFMGATLVTGGTGDGRGRCLHLFEKKKKVRGVVEAREVEDTTVV